MRSTERPRPTASTSPGVTTLPREAAARDEVATRSLSAGNSAGIAAIQRVTQDRVDQQLTAKTLIGKTVFDNQGHRIGEVKDVVLDASGAPTLAGALANRNASESSDRPDTSRSASSSGSMSSATPSVTDRNSPSTSASGARMGGSSTNPSGTAGSAGSSRESRGPASRLGSISGWGNSPSAIISLGGCLGMVDNLLRVPLDQLSHDGANDRITLNVAQTEPSSLPNPSDMAKSAAE